MRIVILGSLALLTACTDPALEQRVADLEAKVTAMEAGGGAATAAKAAGPSEEDQERAAALYKEAEAAIAAGDSAGARAKLETIKTELGRTRPARNAAKMLKELEVVGIDAGELEVEEWFQGDASLADGKATLVVFWEVWCPHCRREVPKMQQLHETYGSQGLQVVGLTRLSKNKTKDEVMSFVAEQGVTYPIAKGTGETEKRMAVSGIPAAAVVKDGKVVWRGHPGRLDDDMIKGWL